MSEAKTAERERVPVGQRRDWARVLARRVALTDFVVLVWVVFGTQIGWLGLDSTVMGFSGSRDDIFLSYSTVSLAIILLWYVTLSLFDTRSPRVLGAGPQEYRGVAVAAVRIFGAIAIIAFLFKIDLARGYILIAFPLGLIVLLFSRWMWRQWLTVVRHKGEFSAKVLLVGSVESASTIAKELARSRAAGYDVLGACVPAHVTGDTLPNTDVPIRSGLKNALAVMREVGADTLVVTSADELGPQQVRELSWGLIPGVEHLVVAPSLMDIGGPRIHTRPVAGLPLIHIETPKFEGRKLLAKRSFDIAGATVLLVLLALPIALLALIVKFTSPGPILFRQQRVGIDGAAFHMLKFRSMVIDAEARLAELVGARDVGNPVMFKMKDDPRVTRVGKWMRRFSLDELPQLLNVLSGTMSLVGPRPPLPREVEGYDHWISRRFLVKPGITGLWQVSGRSRLSWEDTVRLDLYYVENWSLTGDIVILWRTLRAVLSSTGAY